MSDEFVNVNETNPVWEPKFTGKKKTNDLKPLEATDKSYFVGYYLKSKHGLGPQKNSTIHEFKIDSCGAKSHLPSGVEKGGKVSIWGTGVLNGKIEDNLNGGEFIKITWLGIKQPEKVGGNEYHNWNLGIHPTVEPLNLGGNLNIPEKNVNTSPPLETAPDDSLDDLPF